MRRLYWRIKVWRDVRAIKRFADVLTSRDAQPHTEEGSDG